MDVNIAYNFGTSNTISASEKMTRGGAILAKIQSRAFQRYSENDPKKEELEVGIYSTMRMTR